jgi:hypothetical protein
MPPCYLAAGTCEIAKWGNQHQKSWRCRICGTHWPRSEFENILTITDTTASGSASPPLEAVYEELGKDLPAGHFALKTKTTTKVPKPPPPVPKKRDA